MKGWRWNVLDAALVGLQLFEEAMHAAESVWNLSLIRMLRVLRLLRTLRVIRMVHLVRELRTLAGSICNAMKPFLWTAVMLLLMIYIVGVYFMQVLIEHQRSHPTTFERDPGLEQYWGSLPFAFLSLFQALMGGADWENIVNPLIHSVSPWMCVVFVLYVAFASFVVLNLIGGLFFDLTFKHIRDTKDREVVNQVKELLLEMDTNHSGTINLKEFTSQLNNPLMQAYFKVIDLHPSEAEGLFGLLDLNGMGHIDAQDFVLGCLRLRGPARALDLATLVRDIRQMFTLLRTSTAEIQAQLSALNLSSKV
jgi:hypothetical protein